ncbi:MAG: hypothetical protein ABJA83_09500 [Burkholderiaceae bacterium]
MGFRNGARNDQKVLVVSAPLRAVIGFRSSSGRSISSRALAVAVAVLAFLGVDVFAAEKRANYFNDPFVQVTGAIDSCPTPPGPLITETEMKMSAHARAERGTRCYLSGRCRLPNAYHYDQEIIPRVKKAILADGRFADTSVWAEGQRRWVILKDAFAVRNRRGRSNSWCASWMMSSQCSISL